MVSWKLRRSWSTSALLPAVVLRVFVADETLRLEIENPGVAGVIEPGAGGYRLELVQLLAAHWGVNRRENTNVWFEMKRA
jgi:hypothetical protein